MDIIAIQDVAQCGLCLFHVTASEVQSRSCLCQSARCFDAETRRAAGNENGLLGPFPFKTLRPNDLRCGGSPIAWSFGASCAAAYEDMRECKRRVGRSSEGRDLSVKKGSEGFPRYLFRHVQRYLYKYCLKRPVLIRYRNNPKLNPINSHELGDPISEQNHSSEYRRVTVRIRLLSLSNSVHYLLVGTHHILLDGHSFNVLFLDLDALYSNRSLPALPDASQYRAFARQQRQLYETCRMASALEYYRAVIPHDLKPISLLPFAKSQVRPPLDRYCTHDVQFQIQPPLASKLKHLARRHRSTSFHLYLAALQALIFRMLPETNEFFIGIADANKLDKDFMNSVGMLFNLLPLRFDRPEPSVRFSDVIQTARTKAYAAL